jgi:hypothetical protein
LDKEGENEDEGLPKESIGLSVRERGEDEDVFLEGRRSNEEGKREDEEAGDSMRSGETSPAFRFSPRLVTGDRTTPTIFSPAEFDFRSLTGVPVLRKTHFFLIEAQAWQTRPLPALGRRQSWFDVAHRSHYQLVS